MKNNGRSSQEYSAGKGILKCVLIRTGLLSMSYIVKCVNLDSELMKVNCFWFNQNKSLYFSENFVKYYNIDLKTLPKWTLLGKTFKLKKTTGKSFPRVLSRRKYNTVNFQYLDVPNEWLITSNYQTFDSYQKWSLPAFPNSHLTLHHILTSHSICGRHY